MGGEGSSANMARGVEGKKGAGLKLVLIARQIIRTIRVAIPRRISRLIKSTILMGP